MASATHANSRPAGRQLALAATLASLGIPAACGGGGGGGGAAQSGITGAEVQKPGGGSTFFVDPNRSGTTTRLQIAEMFWGRIVDVHDFANGDVSPAPKFRDLVINENIQSDSINYLLQTNPITEATRLVILREKGAPSTGSGTFETLLAQAASGLPGILPNNDDGTSAGPFSVVARNSCLVIRFNDCLDDSALAERDLSETVRVVTGYAPSTPFAPRLVFDPNHGAIAQGAFHSTRILIDLTVSEAESATLQVPLPVNTLGLPASLATTNEPNASIHIPTQVDVGSGQFEVLRGLAGGSVAFSLNGPVAAGSPTRDVVRAFRAGNPADTNNGFLLDLNAPEILGSWGLTLSGAAHDPAGRFGFDFIVDVGFSSVCQDLLAAGDIISIGSFFLEVRATSAPPDMDEAFGCG